MQRMKKLVYTLTVLLLLGSVAEAQTNQATVLNARQAAKIDLSGKWVGKRKQYTADKRSFIEIFEYEFELKQEGNRITGTTTILNSNGEYAEMKLEGILMGNKLHFREYEVKDAIRPEGKVWCFKSGELYIAKEGEQLKLIGSTPSFMEIYNYPCSGGYTEITKVDNSANLSALKSDFSGENLLPEEQMNISVFPNPYIESTTVYYGINQDAKVKLEVFDLSGRLVSTLYSGQQKAGTYNFTFNGKANGYGSGMFIAKLTVNDEVFSRQIVQMQ